MKKTVISVIAAFVCTQLLAVNILVDTKGKGPAVPSTMYGIFFEDINFAADGGLYAEMVKNRSFEFPQSLMGWSSFGGVEVRNDGPFERNPHYVRLTDPGHRSKFTMLVNEGFFGYDFQEGASYHFSVWARACSEPASLRVELADPSADGETQVLAQQQIKVEGSEWKKYEVSLTSGQSVKDGRLRIFLEKTGGAADIEHVSLFPAETWNGGPLRKDLAQALYDLHPGVLRFPGGCIVEGTEYFDRYQWKNTVGPVENRPLNNNRWNFEFPYRDFPDYFQTGGLGFYEYFVLSEEIGAAPLPVLNVGMVCQFENPDPSVQISADELEEYIQDAVDLVEFANGGVSTKWGSLRAQMGHPEPFGLKYLAIGNEQWGDEYVRHLAPFVKELRAKCPEIQIIGSAGPFPGGEWFDSLWKGMRDLNVDLVDEHYYRDEKWFLDNAGRYDDFPRTGPKVFAGEYACHGKGYKRNHANASLCEAAFMTGLERNADVVPMATYAPLFAHVKGWQWRPDLIWFDNSSSVRTASYYVQQLFSLNKGVQVVPATVGGETIKGNDGIYANAVKDADGSLILKVVNVNESEQPLEASLKGFSASKAEVTTLVLDGGRAENSLENPHLIEPVSSKESVSSGVYKGKVPAKSLVVYRFRK